MSDLTNKLIIGTAQFKKGYGITNINKRINNKEIKKFLFLGSDREKNRFFEQAQSAGFIHFIDFRSQSTEEIPKEVHDVAAAIKILRGFPLDHQVSTSIEKPAETIVGQILSLQRKKEEAEEEERLLKNHHQRIRINSNISVIPLLFSPSPCLPSPRRG